jgi:hypothetical protein
VELRHVLGEPGLHAAALQRAADVIRRDPHVPDAPAGLLGEDLGHLVEAQRLRPGQREGLPL